MNFVSSYSLIISVVLLVSIWVEITMCETVSTLDSNVIFSKGSCSVEPFTFKLQSTSLLFLGCDNSWVAFSTGVAILTDCSKAEEVDALLSWSDVDSCLSTCTSTGWLANSVLNASGWIDRLTTRLELFELSFTLLLSVESCVKQGRFSVTFFSSISIQASLGQSITREVLPKISTSGKLLSCCSVTGSRFGLEFSALMWSAMVLSGLGDITELADVGLSNISLLSNCESLERVWSTSGWTDRLTTRLDTFELSFLLLLSSESFVK